MIVGGTVVQRPLLHRAACPVGQRVPVADDIFRIDKKSAKPGPAAGPHGRTAQPCSIDRRAGWKIYPRGMAGDRLLSDNL